MASADRTFYKLKLENVYVTPPTIEGGLLYTPSSQTIKSDLLLFELSKTGQITTQAVLDDGFVFYLFIFAESLKKYRKIINFIRLQMSRSTQ